MKKKPAPAPPDWREWDSPFCIAEHEWIPHEWLGDFPPGSIVKDNGPGKLALVRTGEMVRHSKTIFELAGEGNPEAIAQLVRQTVEGCQVLQQLAETKPDLVRPYARTSWRWPVLMSLHPHLCDDFETILANLQLGRDTPLELLKMSRWIFNAATEISFALLSYLWLRRAAQRNKHELPGPIGKLADKLPEFNSDTAAEWWAVAERVFLATYPEPEKIPELDDLVTAESHRKYPSRRRERILEKVRNGFLAFIGGRKAGRATSRN